MKWMLLCLGLGAAGIAAAEVTLEGFPTHWTQDEAYRTYTPEHCPPGCVAIAGAASQLGDQYGDKYGRVPDSWLEAYFIDLLMQGNSLKDVAAGDFDGDGLLNWEEYVAGTDPRDASSRFRITGFTLENGVPTLTWAPHLPNRVYRRQGKATLDGDWQDDPSEDARFFRVTVDTPAN